MRGPPALRAALLVALVASARARAACPHEGDGHGFTLLVATHASPNESVARAQVDRSIAALRDSPYAASGLDVRLVGELPRADCEVVTKDSLVPTLRCSTAVNAALAPCGASHFELIILSSEHFTSRAGVASPAKSGAVFVSTSEPKWTRDLLHELGHTLGLRDERPSLAAKAKSPALAPGPNCAANEAEARRRWGDLLARGQAGLHRGCAGHRDWLRPDERTLMGFPHETATFGATNARYVRDAIRCCFTRAREGCDDAAKRNPELAACLR